MVPLRKQLSNLNARIAEYEDIKREKERLFRLYPYEFSLELGIHSLAAQLEAFKAERDELIKQLQRKKGSGHV